MAAPQGLERQRRRDRSARVCCWAQTSTYSLPTLCALGHSSRSSRTLVQLEQLLGGVKGGFIAVVKERRSCTT
jgi:hypothetical protein